MVEKYTHHIGAVLCEHIINPKFIFT